MELSEALEIVEETIAMFQEFCVMKSVSMKIDGENFMLTPVKRSFENCFDDETGEIIRKEMIYYTYRTIEGEERTYLEDIRPVCKCLINEWPSQKTRRLRELLIDMRNQCYFEYGSDLLDEEDLDLATTGKEESRVVFLYNRRQRSKYNIRTFVMDTLFEICRAIRATEDDDEKTDTISNSKKDIVDEIEASLHPEVQKRIHDSYKKSHQNRSSKTKPAILCSEEAEAYWQLLKEKGFVDDGCRLLPETSRKQAMLIADFFAEKLNLETKWKPFQEFWGINNLAQEKWKCQQTGISITRQKEIMDIFDQ